MAAAIEYGINILNGEKVTVDEACRGNTYKCPYCGEKLNFRKGEIKVPYFAHSSISDRTPQQKICPGYKGGDEYIKNVSEADKIYITNGGIPLYLCNDGTGTYQLHAVFPTLSAATYDLLDSCNAKVEIDENMKVKSEYFISRIRDYRIKTLSPLIKVKVNGLQNKNEEVMRKWEWGIKGLDIKNDLFHSHFLGGYRVALHANITVGKEYLYLHDGTPKSISGVSFSEKGTLVIGQIYNKRIYKVYGLVVQRITEQAKIFIQVKGYQLITESDAIIPVWPPAVIEGKTLIYKKERSKAYLYHKKKSNQQIYDMWAQSKHKHPIQEIDDTVICSVDDMVLLLSDQKFNIYSGEIRYELTKGRNNYERKKCLVPLITCKNGQGVTVSLGNKNEVMRQNKLIFNSNIDTVTILAMMSKYVLLSTPRTLMVPPLKNSIVILMGPFGKLKYTEDKEKSIKPIKPEIDLEKYIQKLYVCHSSNVSLPNFYNRMIDYAQKNSKELSRILFVWKYKNCIPFEAVKILYQLKGKLIDEK
jgi:hypothetical protein